MRPNHQLQSVIAVLMVRMTHQVISLAGELLGNAEGLIRSGLHTTEVAEGYIKAGEKVCPPNLDTLTHRKPGCLRSAKATEGYMMRMVCTCLYCIPEGFAMQALAILETLVMPGSETLDVRDASEVDLALTIYKGLCLECPMMNRCKSHVKKPIWHQIA